jgi:hypothetical protein
MSLENCRPISTPLSTTERLAREAGTTLGTKDYFRYCNIVGGLQYLTLTHPDLSVTVNKVCERTYGAPCVVLVINDNPYMD